MCSVHNEFNQSTNPSAIGSAPSMLPSECLVEDSVTMQATSVVSNDGEVLPLERKVNDACD